MGDKIEETLYAAEDYIEYIKYIDDESKKEDLIESAIQDAGDQYYALLQRANFLDENNEEKAKEIRDTAFGLLIDDDDGYDIAESFRELIDDNEEEAKRIFKKIKDNVSEETLEVIVEELDDEEFK